MGCRHRLGWIRGMGHVRYVQVAQPAELSTVAADVHVQVAAEDGQPTIAVAIAHLTS